MKVLARVIIQVALSAIFMADVNMSMEPIQTEEDFVVKKFHKTDLPEDVEANMRLQWEQQAGAATMEKRNPNQRGRMPPRPVKYICGSDKKIYKNECNFISRRCNFDSSLVRIPMVHCEKGTLPENLEQYADEPDERAMCGSNSKTYQGKGSRCEFLLDQCDDDLILFAHPGKCNDCSPENICPNQSSSNNPKKKLCGTDGEMYDNLCEMFKRNCQLVAKGKQAVAVSKKKETCASYYRPDL